VTDAPRRVWAEIDLDAITHNLTVFTRLVAPARVMAVVKADAYGHGAAAVARAVEAGGAAALGTATVGEAVALREEGVRLPIVVLGPARGEEEAALAAEVAVTVVDAEGFQAASAAARRRGATARVHIKVDTGMTRLGADPERLGDMLDRAPSGDHVRVEGVFTHLAAAEDDPEFTREQVARFATAARTVRARFPAALRHVTATAGTLTAPGARFEMVRLGLGLYGLLPAPHLAAMVPEPLRPAMSLWSRVVQVRSVPAGTRVSYGRTYRTAGRTRVATVSVGYADGFPRLLGNRGRMSIGGRFYPVAGHVTMDYTMLDLGPDGPPVRVGEPVMVFGPGLPAEEVAAAASTVGYEILCGVGPRVARIYRHSEAGDERNRRAAPAIPAAPAPLLAERP
jgi:alanine racemase